MSSSSFPSLSFEHELFAKGFDFIIGIDEVGRGALAGPVTVGLALICRDELAEKPVWPSSLKDSKLLSETVRESLMPQLSEWLLASATGSSSPQEIDTLGISKTLALAAERGALSIGPQLPFGRGVVILDGAHNWLGPELLGCQVVTKVKADRDCVTVAAASVVAKVTRDRVMRQIASSEPSLASFGFEDNKGYSSAAHIATLQSLGPSSHHRVTWLTKILNQNTLF